MSRTDDAFHSYPVASQVPMGISDSVADRHLLSTDSGSDKVTPG
jgi:hypothetical protein